MRWSDFRYYQRHERVAIIFLLILIVLILVFNGILSVVDRNNEVEFLKNDSIQKLFESYQKEYLESEKLFKGDSSSHQKKYNRKNQSEKNNHYSNNNRSKKEYTQVVRAEKLLPGETISLNETDTAEWKKIPGIGGSFASRIVKYRNLLGGYASIEQLYEVYGMSYEKFSSIKIFIREDSNFNKLNINYLGFKELLRHPYLNYKQVHSIFDIKKKTGKISSISTLSMLDDFSEKDIERLKPYLVFDQ